MFMYIIIYNQTTENDMTQLTFIEKQAVLNALGLRRIELEKQGLNTEDHDKLVKKFK